MFSHIVHGRRRLDAEWARLFAEYLGHTPQYWLNLQSDEDLADLERGSSSHGRYSFSGFGAAGMLCDTEIEDLIEQGILGVSDFDEHRLRPASYDCRAGSYIDPDGRWTPIVRPKAIEAGATLRLRSLERISVPVHLAGSFSATSELAERGIAVASGDHIHPGHDGFLSVTVHNLLDTPVTIQPNDRFLSVRFITMTGTPLRTFDGPDREEVSRLEAETYALAQRSSKLDSKIETLERTLSALVGELRGLREEQDR